MSGAGSSAAGAASIELGSRPTARHSAQLGRMEKTLPKRQGSLSSLTPADWLTSMNKGAWIVNTVNPGSTCPYGRRRSELIIERRCGSLAIVAGRPCRERLSRLRWRENKNNIVN